MKGIMIGGMHSLYDMGLLLKSYPTITPPSPKTHFVEVLGADSALNLSKALTGHMQYNRRTITMEFNIMAPREEWPEKHSEIMDMLHGEELPIVLEDDPEYFYCGLVSVEGFDPQKVTSVVKIVADVEPYKMRTETTRRTATVSGEQTITITGGKMPMIPTITASSAMAMTFGGVSYPLEAGENIFPDVVMRSGINAFTFEGEGTVILEYREGRF